MLFMHLLGGTNRLYKCINGCAHLYCLTLSFIFQNGVVAKITMCIMKGANEMEKEIAKRIIEIHDIMDFIDDGYHNQDIHNLIKISNELFSKLSSVNQKKFQEWCDKKYGV